MTARWHARPQLDTKLWPLSAWPTWSHGWLGPSCSPQYHCPHPHAWPGRIRNYRVAAKAKCHIGFPVYPWELPPSPPHPSQASGPRQPSPCWTQLPPSQLLVPCPNRLGLPRGRDSTQCGKQVKISENSPRALRGILKVLFSVTLISHIFVWELSHRDPRPSSWNPVYQQGFPATSWDPEITAGQKHKNPLAREGETEAQIGATLVTAHRGLSPLSPLQNPDLLLRIPQIFLECWGESRQGLHP